MSRASVVFKPQDIGAVTKHHHFFFRFLLQFAPWSASVARRKNSSRAKNVVGSVCRVKSTRYYVVKLNVSSALKEHCRTWTIRSVRISVLDKQMRIEVCSKWKTISMRDPG